MFELRDPRAEAFSQAGNNFGKGLSDQLINSIENDRLKKALEGGDANDPYAMLQRFADNRVSAEKQRQFFDPVVQQRIANQDALKQLKEGLANVKSPEDLAYLLAQAQVAQNKDFDMKSIIDLYRGKQWSDALDDNNPNVPDKNATSNPTQPTQPNTPPSQRYPGVGKADNEAAPNNVINKPGLVGNLPAPISIPLLTQPEINKMRKQYYRELGREDGEKMVQQKIADNRREYENASTTRNQSVTENDQFLARQDRAKKFVGDRVAAKYQGNSNYIPVFTEMAKDLATETYKDSEEAAFAEVDAKYIDPLMQKINAIDQKIPSSKLVLNSLDSSQKQDLLKNVNVDINAMLKDVPEAYRKEVYDQVRQKLATKNGLGVIGADYAMTFPGQKLKARMNAIGDAPKQRILQGGVGGFGFMSNPAYAKQIGTAEKKLVSLLKAELPRTPATILKDLYVNGLGYPDKSFDDALSKVIEEGDVKIPSYLQSAYQDTKKAANPNFIEYMSNEGLRARGEVYK